MNFRTKIYSHIEDIPKKVWSSIPEKNVLSSSSYFNVLQTTNPDIKHRYIVLYQGEHIVGKLYVQLIAFYGSELKSYLPDKKSGFWSKTVQAIVNCALENIHWNLAILGNIFITGDDGQYWAEGISGKDRWNMIHQAMAHLQQQEEIDAILFSDIYRQALSGSEDLEKLGYRRFGVEPDMLFYVDPQWNNYQDYLSSLSSKYRVRANKVHEKSSLLTIKQLQWKDIQQEKEQLEELYHAVVERAEFKLGTLSTKCFLSMKETFPDTFYVQAYYLKEKMVGFISYYVDQHDMNVHMVGLDYAYNKTYKVYNRILYDCVREGIQHSVKQIHFGRTASAIKTTVGAAPVPVYSFLKHNDRISNIAIKPLTEYLKPEPFEVRHPFKKNNQIPLANAS